MDGITKFIQLAARHPDGTPTVQLLHPDTMEKVAARGHPLIKQAAAELPQRDDGIWVLLNAVSAYEYWGSNSNGDAFPEASLKFAADMSFGCPRSSDYGFKTFEKYAYPYRHHCFPSGTRILLSNRQRLPIEDVRAGDSVIGLDGPKKVNRVMGRHYQGAGVRITATGIHRKLSSTADHPILIYRRSQVHCRHGYSRISKNEREYRNCIEYRDPIGSPQWVAAAKVKPGDYVLVPVCSHGEIADGTSLPELVGWVASEGCLGRHGSIQFTFGSREHEKRLKPLFSSFGANLGIHIRRDNGLVMMSACNKKLHARLSKYVVGKFSEKSLTAKVLDWNRDSLLRMIGSYMDGDGCVSKTGKNRGWLRIRSSSEPMMCLLSDIVRSLNTPVGVNIDCAPGTMVSPTNGLEYVSRGSGVVTVCRSFAHEMCGYAEKAAFLSTPKRNYPRKIIDGCQIHAVTEVRPIPISETVYNLEVGGDHTYVAEEMVVHNCNKDPKKSIGERVKLAVWNDDMKRVELIHFLRRDSMFDEFGDVIKVGAPDLVQNIENGDEVSVSMGTKVPFDLCSKCHHKAKNVSLYCDHLKYAMNQVMPDGSQIYAINTLPKFFDISYVLRGAEKTAKVLKNLSMNLVEVKKEASNKTYVWVAEGLEKAASENREYCLPSAYYAEMVKSAQDAASKSATITKKVPIDPSPVKGYGDFAVPMLRSLEPHLPGTMLARCANYSLPEICSTMTGMGMMLHPQEMRRIVVIKIQGGAKPDDVGAPKVDPQHIRPSLIQLLKSQLEKRSSFRNPLRRRVQDLLCLNGEQLLDKLAANEEAMRGLEAIGETEPGVLEKAAPLAALAAALYTLYRKNIQKAALPKFLEQAFRSLPELPAAIIGAGIGGAFGLAGQSLIQGFGAGIPKEASKKGIATAAGIFAAPYLYSGYVQQKALKGEPIGKYEASAARHPGTLGIAGLAAYLKRGAIGKKLVSLVKGKKSSAQKAKEFGLKRRPLVKKACATISNHDILAYASDNEVVDRAIAAGLAKIAARIIEAMKQPA